LNESIFVLYSDESNNILNKSSLFNNSLNYRIMTVFSESKIEISRINGKELLALEYYL